jgi:hemolysin III
LFNWEKRSLLFHMNANLIQKSRHQTIGEEIANAVSHGIGFLGAAAITPILIVIAIPAGSAAVVGQSIFGATMILLYLASTLYHALPHSRGKQIFQIFDHAAIFLLIAGTYTPFTLGLLRGAWGWTLFGVVWGLALVGVLVKSIGGANSGKLSTALYLAMGWLAIIAIRPLWMSMPAWGLGWLLAGGLFYSGGVIFFVFDRMRFSHFIWHLFVLAGTACHVVAVMVFSS